MPHLYINDHVDIHIETNDEAVVHLSIVFDEGGGGGRVFLVPIVDLKTH